MVQGEMLYRTPSSSNRRSRPQSQQNHDVTVTGVVSVFAETGQSGSDTCSESCNGSGWFVNAVVLTKKT